MAHSLYDVLAFAAHPDDLEAVMGGTAAKLAAKGRSILFVDLCDGEPTRYGDPGERTEQGLAAAAILGVDRLTLALQDRLIRDTSDARLEVARLVRRYKPRLVFTTAGSGVHPDHQEVTDIVVNGVFYARSSVIAVWSRLGLRSTLRWNRGGCGTAHVGTPSRGSSHTCSTHHNASTAINVNAVSVSALLAVSIE